MSEITIYGGISCGKCKQLKKICENKQYKFTYKNVEPGDDDFKKLSDNSVKSFPAIEINGEFIFNKNLQEFESIIASHQD